MRPNLTDSPRHVLKHWNDTHAGLALLFVGRCILYSKILNWECVEERRYWVFAVRWAGDRASKSLSVYSFCMSNDISHLPNWRIYNEQVLFFASYPSIELVAAGDAGFVRVEWSKDGVEFEA